MGWFITLLYTIQANFQKKLISTHNQFMMYCVSDFTPAVRPHEEQLEEYFSSLD